MLNSKQIKEIREHLEKAQNPIFFFDNDADGLASFLLLRRYVERGYGVAVKSFPDLNESYARKITELNADYVFVLDKPIISQKFLEQVDKIHVPLVWIDHHEVYLEFKKKINYYNPLENEDKHSEPVSYLCYQITEKKDDDWIALIGCIGDNFIPDFSKKVEQEYPDYWKHPKTAFEGLYETELGKIIKILSFGLKDRTGNVVKMLKFLVGVKSPSDILEENHKTYSFLKRYRQVNRRYSKLLEKGKSIARNCGKLLFFQYGGELSLSADLANELHYNFPKKVVVVAYLKGTKANISLRGRNMKKITEKAIRGLDDASGGGHDEATGAKINVEDLPIFKERIEKEISKL